MRSTTRSNGQEVRADAAHERRYRVLIVDDHPVICEGYRQLIACDARLEICGVAAASGEALQIIRDKRPHLALVDLSLSKGHGLELCKQIRSRFEQLKLLVVSAHDERLFAERALKAGASGYLHKGEACDRLLDAIHAVLEGRVVLGREMTERVLDRLTRRGEPDSPLEDLSDREIEVLELLGSGLGTQDIARWLSLSPKTVDSYREGLKRELGLTNSTELVRRAVLFVLQNE
ncbi:MAG: response regulator transcription factor [Planctomycetes bacterium]|nr:response regulator transcription factor [Planctomycetota bacterium]